MSADDSVSLWIAKVKQGDDQAQQVIWDRYFPALVKIARQRLAGQRRRMADEEDVALSALNSFFGAANREAFPNLRGREGLWRLLSEMTRRKAVDLIRYNEREKRRVLGESAVDATGCQSAGIGLDQAAVDELTPDLAAMLGENCQRLLDALDADLRVIALTKLDGHTNAEIAEQLGWSVPTIERRLQLIRKKWQRVIDE